MRYPVPLDLVQRLKYSLRGAQNTDRIVTSLSGDVDGLRLTRTPFERVRAHLFSFQKLLYGEDKNSVHD